MTEHDLIVIGGGPGGHIAAMRAAELGLDVACIDENERLGGVCLRIGCIPSKALLESSWRLYEARHRLEPHGIRVGQVELDLGKMMQRKRGIVQRLSKGLGALLKQRKITTHRGRARLEADGKVVLTDNDDQSQTLSGKHIILATGSRPMQLPGIELDRPVIGTSEDALAYEDVPERLVVVGAGYIGVELGSVWQRLGASVTVVELKERILPEVDEQLARIARKEFEKQGMTFVTGCQVKSVTRNNGACTIEREDDDPLEADRVLIAAGRRPNVDDLGLEEAGVELDPAGRIAVNDRFETAAEGVCAIGDCIRGPMLAHKASEEGVACVEQIVNGCGRVDYDTIPSVIFTHPEIAAVGRDEAQLREAGIDVRIGEFTLRANGRSLTLEEPVGLVKVLADGRTDRVLGVRIIGARAGDLIAEATASMAFGASSEDIARVCHTHPTVAEATGDAARAVRGRAFHA